MPNPTKWIPPAALVTAFTAAGGTAVWKGAPWWVGVIIGTAGVILSIPIAILAEYKWLASHYEAKAEHEAQSRHQWISHAGALMVALGTTNWVLETVRSHVKGKPELVAQIDSKIASNKMLIEIVEQSKTRPE